jgi:cytoskeletal protein CcmA (bactofilin family)
MPSRSNSSSTGSEAPTVIGRDAVITGELSSEQQMLIEGRVHGKIRSKSQVIIGETGQVEAEVHAEVVTVRGTLTGDCEGFQKVEITASGKLFGNISAKVISVAEGATFRGASKMSRTAASAREQKTSSSSVSASGSPQKAQEDKKRESAAKGSGPSAPGAASASRTH